MVTIDLRDEAAAGQTIIPLHFQTRGSQRAAKTLLCAVEKEKLREEIKPFKQNLADLMLVSCHMLF